jgi:hypothetical protein
MEGGGGGDDGDSDGDGDGDEKDADECKLGAIDRCDFEMVGLVVVSSLLCWEVDKADGERVMVTTDSETEAEEEAVKVM